MKLQLLVSTALTLLTAANGVLSEPASIRGAVTRKVDAESASWAKAEEDEMGDDVYNRTPEQRQDDRSGRRNKRRNDRQDRGQARRDNRNDDIFDSSFTSSFDGGRTPKQRQNDRSDRRNDRRNDRRDRGRDRRNDRNDNDDDEDFDGSGNDDRYVGRPGSTYRRGRIGDDDDQRTAYGYGNCWPRCTPPADEDSKNVSEDAAPVVKEAVLFAKFDDEDEDKDGVLVDADRTRKQKDCKKECKDDQCTSVSSDDNTCKNACKKRCNDNSNYSSWSSSFSYDGDVFASEDVNGSLQKIALRRNLQEG